MSGKDHYMDNIASAIKRERESNRARRLHIKLHIKEVEQAIAEADTEMKKLQNRRRQIRTARKRGYPDCDHTEGQHNYMMMHIDSGLGYAGRYCTRCGTLRNEPDYPEFEKKPTEPFKKDCKHKFIKYRDIMDTYGNPILDIYGKWCSVCGLLESDENR